jgi:hypothetical protein
LAAAAAGGAWERGVCPATGRTYWFNEETQESTYEDPSVPAAGRAAPGGADAGGGGFDGDGSKPGDSPGRGEAGGATAGGAEAPSAGRAHAKK